MNAAPPSRSLLGTLKPLGGPGGSSRRWRWGFFILVTLATLWAGLDPKDYRFRNEVAWLDGRPGVRFGRFGRIHTGPLLTADTAARLNQGGFTLTLVISPTNAVRAGFRTLAAVHAGDDRSQLVLGQWRDFIIAMNGNDYDHKRRQPRITADTSLFPQRPLLLTVVSAPGGTSLYLNGARVAINARLRLTLPATADRAGRLVLGNSLSANQPWAGELVFCELLPRPLSPGEIPGQYQGWVQRRALPTLDNIQPLLRYDFGEPNAATIENRGTLAAPLHIPRRLHALGPRALAWEVPSGTSNRGLALDIGLNFLGFLPFGCACALLLKSPLRGPVTLLVLAALSGLGLSLLIELTQAWLPSRDSSLRDLLLNTVACPVGAGLLLLAGRFKRGQR